MAGTHAAALNSSLSYRFFCGLLDLVYPATALLDVLKDLDHRAEESGLARALTGVLELLPTPCRTAFPAQGEDQIRTHPIVVFGKHGSILTPFLVATSLSRLDLKMLGASYVAKLGPNIARTMYPVDLPIPTFRRAARRGILLRIGAWLTAKLDTPVDKMVARERNRTSLIRAAEHVLGGGALLIAPDARNPKEKWRSGIGILVAHIARSDTALHETRLVPYRVWAPITGIFHLLSRNPFLRAVGRWQYRQPVRVVLGEPILLSEVIRRTGLDPIAITEHLESHYRSLGF